MPGPTFEAPTVGIGKLLGEGSRLHVPDHQRDFSWTADEIEQFISDIQDAHARKQPEYFAGLMVFIRRNSSEYTILDGQQRLATTTIFLATIRNWLRAHDHSKDADQIQNDYIALRKLGRDEFKPRLLLNENNNRTFQDFVVVEKDLESIETQLTKLKKHDPNRNLLEALRLCDKQVQGLTQKAKESGLFDLVEYLRDNVKIVQLTVPDEANAFTVFETLNARGLDLSILDLVKNYLFGKCGPDSLREVKMYWTQMMTNLTNVPADDFLKAYWTSRHGRIQSAQMYRSFKSIADSPRKIADTSLDMQKASEQYAVLEIADDPFWAVVSERSRESIRALKILAARQSHPVLLSALARFSPRELQRLIRLLEVFIVRYQLIGGGRTGRLEIACAGLAAAIYDGKVKSANEAFREIRSIYPSDDDFRANFAEKQERNGRKARFILETLEVSLAKKGAKELTPSKSLTLEHILPRNPDSSWKNILEKDEDFADECTYRLGNLCLLTSVNKELGAKSFAEKRKVYAQSALVFTKRLSDYPEWNRESVEKRQTEMARNAVSAWRFD
jgi:hypothetical protein